MREAAHLIAVGRLAPVAPAGRRNVVRPVFPLDPAFAPELAVLLG
ncbi:hypothetical protein [Salinispora oceanensis]|nr:hypothetical protein [Salinispora oceanensis]